MGMLEALDQAVMDALMAKAPSRWPRKRPLALAIRMVLEADWAGFTLR